MKDYTEPNRFGGSGAKTTGCVIECTAPWGGYPVGLYYPDGRGNYFCDSGQCIELAWTKSKSEYFREVFYDHEAGITKPLFMEKTKEAFEQAVSNGIPKLIEDLKAKKERRSIAISYFMIGLATGLLIFTLLLRLTLNP